MNQAKHGTGSANESRVVSRAHHFAECAFALLVVVVFAAASAWLRTAS
jgi:hypothetical protein